MKRFMKHFITTSLCLVLALVALVGCKKNLGAEITAEADVQAAQTAITTAVGDTMAYEGGYTVKGKASMKGSMSGSSIDGGIEFSYARTGTGDDTKVRTTNILNMKLSGKGMSTNIVSDSDIYMAKVGEEYVVFDVNAENKHTFQTIDANTADIRFQAYLPTLDEVIYDSDSDTGASSLLSDLDFESMDADTYKLYKVNDTTYNLAVNKEVITDDAKIVTEIVVKIADGKVVYVDAKTTTYNNTNEEATTDEEKVWEKGIEIVAEFTISYGDTEIVIPTVDLEKFEEVSRPESVGPESIF